MLARRDQRTGIEPAVNAYAVSVAFREQLLLQWKHGRIVGHADRRPEKSALGKIGSSGAASARRVGPGAGVSDAAGAGIALGTGLAMV